MWSAQGYPCLYPRHVTITLKAGLNSAGCQVPVPVPKRSHYQVAPSESLGLWDSVLPAQDRPFDKGLGMFGALGMFSLHFLPAGVGRSVHEIANAPSCGLHPPPSAPTATLSCFFSCSINSLIRFCLKQRPGTHSGVG